MLGRKKKVEKFYSPPPKKRPVQENQSISKPSIFYSSSHPLLEIPETSISGRCSHIYSMTTPGHITTGPRKQEPPPPLTLLVVPVVPR